MDEIEIVRYGPDQRDQVTSTLADAFLYGPVPDWLIPDHEIRRQVFLRYFTLYAEHLLAHGLVYGTPDLSGVACWLDLLGANHPPEIDDLDRKLADACGEQWVGRFTQLHDLFDQTHPTQHPHWYLVLIGVRNNWQKRGIGSALLAHHHALLDDQGHAAYLESSSPDNHRLYLRNGYQDMGAHKLPDGGPEIHPMWRPAQIRSRESAPEQTRIRP